MPLIPRFDALGNKIEPNSAPEPARKLRPVSGIFNGERLPIVGTSDDGEPVSVVLVDPSQPIGKIAIGADTVDSVARFQGDMSYVAKWGRILTAGERAAMYCNGAFPGIDC